MSLSNISHHESACELSSCRKVFSNRYYSFGLACLWFPESYLCKMQAAVNWNSKFTWRNLWCCIHVYALITIICHIVWTLSQTRMHSSRMRTTRSLTVSPGYLPSQGGGWGLPKYVFRVVCLNMQTLPSPKADPLPHSLPRQIPPSELTEWQTPVKT